MNNVGEKKCSLTSLHHTQKRLCVFVNTDPNRQSKEEMPSKKSTEMYLICKPAILPLHLPKAENVQGQRAEPADISESCIDESMLLSVVLKQQKDA